MPASALIVKIAAIGDVVMALPMVSAILSGQPGTRITWIAGRAAAPLVQRVDGVSEVIAVDETAILAGGHRRRAGAVLAAWKAVAGRHFDAVYIAHSDPRYRLLAWPARSAHRRWLGESATGRPGIVPGRAHPDEYVRLIIGHDDWRATSFAPPELRASLPADLTLRIAAFNPERKPLVAITPGGARNPARESPLRRWPLDRYATLADALASRGWAVVLVGDRADEWVRPAFERVPVLDLVGSTDLSALVALFAQCAAVVAHDSGPLHLARLAGSRVFALMGPTPPSMFFRPDPRTTVLWPAKALACAPCYDGREFARCDDNRCMQMIGVQDVLRALERASRSAANAPP